MAPASWNLRPIPSALKTTPPARDLIQRIARLSRSLASKEGGESATWCPIQLVLDTKKNIVFLTQRLTHKTPNQVDNSHIPDIATDIIEVTCTRLLRKRQEGSFPLQLWRQISRSKHNCRWTNSFIYSSFFCNKYIS